MGTVRNDLIDEVGETKSHLLLTWAPGMRYLNYDVVSLTWLVVQNALWVCKRLFSAHQAVLPEWIRFSDMEISIWNAFFHGYMVSVLNRKFFFLEASSVCSNIVPSLNRSKYCFSVYSVLRVTIWTMRQEFHEGKFSSLGGLLQPPNQN